MGSLNVFLVVANSKLYSLVTQVLGSIYLSVVENQRIQKLQLFETLRLPVLQSSGYKAGLEQLHKNFYQPNKNLRQKPVKLWGSSEVAIGDESVMNTPLSDLCVPSFSTIPCVCQSHLFTVMAALRYVHQWCRDQQLLLRLCVLLW